MYSYALVVQREHTITQYTHTHTPITTSTVPHPLTVSVLSMSALLDGFGASCSQLAREDNPSFTEYTSSLLIVLVSLIYIYEYIYTEQMCTVLCSYPISCSIHHWCPTSSIVEVHDSVIIDLACTCEYVPTPPLIIGVIHLVKLEDVHIQRSQGMRSGHLWLCEHSLASSMMADTHFESFVSGIEQMLWFNFFGSC